MSRAGSITRPLWLALAYASLGLALVGVVVPLLPTTPFALLAAYAAARGSTRLHRRLLAHPVLGPLIRDWHAHRAVSRRAKHIALAAMAVSAVVVALVAPSAALAAGALGAMLVVGTWLWLRPDPPDDPR